MLPVEGTGGLKKCPKSSEKRSEKLKMSKIPSVTRVVAYLPSLKTILQRLRATSATPSSLSSTLLTTATAGPLTARIPDVASSSEEQSQNQSTQFTDILASPFSSATSHLSLHPSLPLPGAVGPHATPTNSSTPTITSSAATPSSLPSHGSKEEAPTIMSSIIKGKPQGTVECMVQEIPEFLVSQLMMLFPGVSVQGKGLNVITLSQQTLHDMTSWSSEVEEEREQLLEHFVESAKEICSRLNGAGFWADFIDPDSGRAYYSAYSSATLFETDDTFRFFGFDIVDLGCCKCIQHPLWGTFIFVGTIFTNAPTSSPAIQSIMEL